MSATTVHVAILDTMSDWELGYVVAHVNSAEWQREPGRYQVKTVGLSLAPVTTKGGMRIVPDLAVGELRPSESAMLVLVGADIWLDGSGATQPFGAAAR